MKKLAMISLVGLLCGIAWPARVYLMSGGVEGIDNAVIQELTQRGHTVTLGSPYHQFNGSADLSNIDVVYFQMNGNWTSGDMPLLGQIQLVHWLSDPAHGLITTEWTAWFFSVGQLRTLYRVMPIAPNGTYRYVEGVNYTRQTSNSIIDNGLPNSFFFQPSSFSGSESFLVPRSGATVFYSSDYSSGDDFGGGLVGMTIRGGGRSISVSSVGGPSDFFWANYAQLVSNAITWASSGSGALPNVYLMGSRDNAFDDGVFDRLQACGHRPYVGVSQHEFQGLTLMPEVRAIYMPGVTYNYGQMPDVGQLAIVDFLTVPGHGLVTGEWAVWMATVQGTLPILNQVFGAECFTIRSNATIRFTQNTPNATLNDGVAFTFESDMDYYSGTDSLLLANDAGTSYYRSDFTYNELIGSAVIGRRLHSRGRVLHFSSTNGPNQMASANFGRLFCNAFAWVTSTVGSVPGDANSNGCVDDTDLAITLSLFGQTGLGLPADFNNDETVDDTDLAIVLSNFGLGC